MALFGKKKAEEAPKAVKEDKKAVISTFDGTGVIQKPRITEKAALLGDKNVYTFEIKKGATKFEVRDAVKALYKVTPEKIRIVNKAPRHYMSRLRGREMMEAGSRKPRAANTGASETCNSVPLPAAPTL